MRGLADNKAVEDGVSGCRGLTGISDGSEIPSSDADSDSSGKVSSGKVTEGVAIFPFGAAGTFCDLGVERYQKVAVAIGTAAISPKVAKFFNITIT